MSELKRLEQQRKDAEDLLQRRDAALRLADNRDFRKLFIDGYFQTEAARLVQMSSDPALTQEQRADALDMARATGHAKRYLSMMVQMANVAERDMEELDNQIEEARNEEELEETERLAAQQKGGDMEQNEGSVS